MTVSEYIMTYRLSFLCMVYLAVRMVADVTETRNVIPSLELNFYCFEPF